MGPENIGTRISVADEAQRLRAHATEVGTGNGGGCQSDPVAWHNQSCSIMLTLPPLAALYLKRQR
ncbi:MAG TPA: hypothetical protein VF840_08135 [Terriglobales bacterium]